MNPKNAEKTPVLRGMQAKYVSWERVTEYEKKLKNFSVDHVK